MKNCRFKLGVSRSNPLIPWLFLSPLLIVNILVILGPGVGSVYFALTKWSGLGAAEFIGLANFARMLEDPVYHKALTNNVKWTIIFLTVPIAMSLVAAYLLSAVKKGQLVFRLAFFLPYVLPSVVNAHIWQTLFHPFRGIGAQLRKAGYPFLDLKFFGDTNIVLYSIAFVDNWHWWGFLVVVFLAAMQGIDPSLYEAARIDGANRFAQFRYITIPGIRPTLVFMMLMTTIWSFLVFDYIYILTQGGPANASEVLGTYAYKLAFTRFEAGYAAAVGVTMSIITGMIVSLFLYLRRRGWEI
ncbi:MAG: sugar ABC transporter permease [Firmicutes bacterium]|nr:sugar ABC transporter permease [Bacillota bacterium]NLY30086.1 sugar ABC transporter permease [Bacillota bacterium]